MARTILVVDDEPTLRETLVDALEADGFRVVAGRRRPRGARPLPRRAAGPRPPRPDAPRAVGHRGLPHHPRRVRRADRDADGQGLRARQGRRARARCRRLRHQAVQPARADGPRSGPCSGAPSRPSRSTAPPAVVDLGPVQADLGGPSAAARRRGRAAQAQGVRAARLPHPPSRARSSPATSCSSGSGATTTAARRGPSTSTSTGCAAGSRPTRRTRRSSTRSAASATCSAARPERGAGGPPPASAGLVVHPLHRLGGILGGVDRVLEALYRSRHLMTSIGGPVASRNSPATAARDRPSASFSSAWTATRCRSRSLSPSSLRRAAASSTPCSSRIAASRRASSVGPVDAVDDERLGDRLDPVDDVVEPRHELVDVLAVERRHERVLEPAVDLVVDLVAALLERLDRGHALVEIVVLVDHPWSAAAAAARLSPSAANSSKNFGSLGRIRKLIEVPPVGVGRSSRGDRSVEVMGLRAR